MHNTFRKTNVLCIIQIEKQCFIHHTLEKQCFMHNTLEEEQVLRIIQ